MFVRLFVYYYISFIRMRTILVGKKILEKAIKVFAFGLPFVKISCIAEFWPGAKVFPSADMFRNTLGNLFANARSRY